jgi:hypothetical protein
MFHPGRAAELTSPRPFNGHPGLLFSSAPGAQFAGPVAWHGSGHAGKLYPGDIRSITLLGSDKRLEWHHTAEAVTVKFPESAPCDFAYALRIQRN